MSTIHNRFMTMFKFLDIPRMLFLILFLILLVKINLLDPDYFWHLKTGEQILLNGALPKADIFSHTNFNHPWILHEWLFQVLLFTVYTLLGAFGIKVMTAFLAMISLYVTYLTVNRVNHRPVFSALLILAFIVTIYPFISPRPQLISFLFFSLTLFLLIQFKYLKRTRYLFSLPAVMILWVNMHGGYVIGIALLVLFCSCEFISYWQSDRLDKSYRKQLSTLAIITLITALGSSVNPYFIAHWLYPFTVLSMEASRSYISEWQSPDFHLISFQYTLFLILLFFVISAYRQTKPDLTEIIVPLFFIAAGFITSRQMPFAILTIIPFMGIAFAKGTAASISASAAGMMYRKHRSRSRQLGNSEHLLNWTITLIVATGLFLAYPTLEQQQQQNRDKMIPVQATDFILKTGLTGHMFNTYRFGGYLIYRLYPEQRVFIDGRADMYGDDFFQQYIKINSGQADWEKLFNKYAIDYVICERDAAIRQLLILRSDFRLVYDDDNNSVLVKDIPRYAEIISKYGQ
ncbi:MAG: hypothetical protein R8K50_04915 [Mariprofundus sp.]